MQRVTYKINSNSLWIEQACFYAMFMLDPPFKFKYWLRPEPEVFRYAKEYIDGLLKFNSGIKSIDFEKDFKFTWQVNSIATKLKMFGMCTLLRYLEEFPEYIKKWVYLKSFMSESQAYLLCTATTPYQNMVGHLFNYTTYKLNNLKNFTLNEFFNKCNNFTRWGYNPLWSLVGSLSCFDHTSNMPNFINWTPEIYQRFCEVEPINSQAKIEFVLNSSIATSSYEPISISVGNI